MEWLSSFDPSESMQNFSESARIKSIHGVRDGRAYPYIIPAFKGGQKEGYDLQVTSNSVKCIVRLLIWS